MLKHKCFICLKKIKDDCSPKICYCKGSIKSHSKCLNNYLLKYNKDSCDICKHKYKIDEYKLNVKIIKYFFYFLIYKILNILKLSFGLFLLFNVYYGLFYLNYFVLSFFFNINNNLYLIINFLIILEIIYKNIIKLVINIRNNILHKNIILIYKQL